MINEHGELLVSSETENDGSAGASAESSSSNKMPRPYAGADDSMDDIAIGPGGSQSPTKVPKPELLVGDLVWSKIPGHAWWPSMVSYEPNKAVYFQSSGKGKTCFKYHVQFFGDEPQRGWVSDKNMIKFTGKDPAMELPTTVTPKRDKFAHSKQAKAWERALEQAQKALPLNRQQRKLCYVFKYNDDHLSQKITKPSKSPDSPMKKKDKLSKKAVKVKPRVTRRSCLLGKPDVQQEDPGGGSSDDFCDKEIDTENNLDNLDVCTSSSETKNVSLKQTKDKKSSIVDCDRGLRNKSPWKRRGRSAAVIQGLLINAVPSTPNSLANTVSVMTVNEPCVDSCDLIARMEVKDPALIDEKFDKFKVSRLNSKLKEGELASSNKRYRDVEKDELLKKPKKIKLEFLPSKAPYFEIVPKKILKNKQTQTPERKSKKSNEGTKAKSRKKGCTRRNIKTKETHASKKFSRQLKLPTGKNEATKKAVHRKSKKDKRKTFATSAGKQDFQEKKQGFGRRSESLINVNSAENPQMVEMGDRRGENGATGNSSGQEISSTENKKPSSVAGRLKKKGRKSKKRGKRRILTSKPVIEDSGASDTSVNHAIASETSVVGNLAKIATKQTVTEEDRNQTMCMESFDQSTHFELCSIKRRSTGTSSSTRHQNKEKLKMDRLPLRRSTRNHVLLGGQDKEYFVCKARQLLEIDDILGLSSETHPNGKNGINGCIPKESILELIHDFESEIPIEIERTEAPASEVQKIKEPKEQSIQLDKMCTDNPLPEKECTQNNVDSDNSVNSTIFANEESSETIQSGQEIHCDEEEKRKEKELTLYNEPVDGYLHIRSDENLSTCTLISSCQKDDNYQDSFNFEWQERAKDHIKDPHSETLSTGEKGVGLSIPFSDNTLEPEIGSMGMKLMSDRSDEHENVNEIAGCTIDNAGSHKSDISMVMHEHESPTQNFFSSGEERSDQIHENIERDNTVFESEELNGVEDADVYLNADDVGLPVSKGCEVNKDCSKPTVFAKAGDQNAIEPQGKEIDAFNKLGTMPSIDTDFEKSSQLDMHGLVDFQPAFSRQNLPFGPVFACSQSCHEKGFDSTCNVLSSLTTQMTHGEGYIAASKAAINNPSLGIINHLDLNNPSSLRGIPTSNDIIGQSAILSLVDPKKGDLYGVVDYQKSKIVNSVGMSEEDQMETERRENEQFQGQCTTLVSSCGSYELDNPEAYTLVVEKRNEEESSNLLPSFTDCSRSLHGPELESTKDQSDQCPVSAGLNIFNRYENIEQESNLIKNHGEKPPVPDRDERCDMRDDSGCASGLLNVPDSDYLEDNGKTPTKVVEQDVLSTECLNLTSSNSYEVVKSSPQPLSASSSPGHQSPVSQRQSILSSGDSVKSGESPPVNCCKRQRKRKSMSDFHVGIAFDEILSSRGRATEVDKGKPGLGKKKRDGVRKIDFDLHNTVKNRNTVEEEIFDNDSKVTISPEGTKKANKKSKSSDIRRHSSGKKNLMAFEQKSLLNDTRKISVENNRDELNTFVDKASIDVAEDINSLRTDDQEMQVDDQTRNSNPKQGELSEEPKSKTNKSLKTECKNSKSKKAERKVTPKKSALNSPSKKSPKKSGKGPTKSKKNGSRSESEHRATTAGTNTEETLYAEKLSSNDGVQTELAANTVTPTADKKPKRKYVRRKKLNEELKDKTEIVGMANVDKVEKDPPKRGKKKSVSKGKDGSQTKIKGSFQRRKSIKAEACTTEVLVDDIEESKRGRKVRKRKQISLDDKNEAQDYSEMGPPPKRVKRKKSLTKQNRNRHKKASKDLQNSDGQTPISADTGVIDTYCSSDKDSLVNNFDKKSNQTGLEEGTKCSVVDAAKDNHFERSLAVSCVPGKKLKKGEKLETRSNVSDETSSISGKEGDDASKSKRDSICVICEQTEGLLSCNGVCYSSFHPDCLGLSTVPDKFFCDECLTGNHSCFLCKETGKLRKCSYPTCGKFYHQECAEKTPGCRLENNKLYCSLHSCGTCTNDKDSNMASKKRMLRCVRCPTAYHASGCLVAGCMQLTSSLMVCNKHFVPHKSKPHHTHYNVSWCFVCSSGGMLVCCDTCPAAFHPGCVEDLDGVPDEAWQCDSCREGKKPLFGDLVWVKYGFWRWWPARICFPDEIPPRIQNLPHDVGEFPVMFFGSRDYCWLHAGRVFPYQEGDKGCKVSNKSGTNKIFEKAIREVEEAYKELKEIQDKQLEQKLAKQSKKPPPYKHIKTNKYVSAMRNLIDPSEFTLCECSPRAENPCGPGSECLNRMLQIECNKTCKANDKCQNQRFQKCEQVDCVPFKTPRCGWGLKTRQDIKKGDFVIEYVGELIDETTCRKRINDYHDKGIIDYYFLVIDKDNIIDAYPKGNTSRFMNHCCDPNCDTQKWTVNGEIRVGLFANKDIKAGSELMFNYNLDTLGNEKKACQCGSKNCSGFLGVRPKTQNAIALGEKKKKDKQKKKRKSKKDKTKVIRHEDECFACGDGGELIMCDRLSCSKCYHLKCLTLSDMPKGKWDCPWHFCDICGKRASYYCSICPNSFCGSHHDGEIFEISEGVYVCDEHSNDEVNAEKNRVRLSKENSSKATGQTSTGQHGRGQKDKGQKDKGQKDKEQKEKGQSHSASSVLNSEEKS